MRIPGFNRQPRQVVAETPSGPVYLERRSGESTAAFEARLGAAAQTRAAQTDVAPRRARWIGLPARRAAGPKPVRPERRRRHGGGAASLFGFLVVLVAAAGAGWIALSAHEGSFAAGGAVVDRKLAEVTQPARAAANQAVDRTGAAVQNAGQAIETQGQRLRQKAP